MKKKRKKEIKLFATQLEILIIKMKLKKLLIFIIFYHL